jgi:hypothetical protein
MFDPEMQSANGGFFEAILGARKMLAGKVTTLAGAVASGRTLRLRLTQPVPDLLARMTLLCAVPPTLPADPEGAKTPLHSPAPYYGPSMYRASGWFSTGTASIAASARSTSTASPSI